MQLYNFLCSQFFILLSIIVMIDENLVVEYCRSRQRYSCMSLVASQEDEGVESCIHAATNLTCTSIHGHSSFNHWKVPAGETAHDSVSRYHISLFMCVYFIIFKMVFDSWLQFFSLRFSHSLWSWCCFTPWSFYSHEDWQARERSSGTGRSSG